MSTSNIIKLSITLSGLLLLNTTGCFENRDIGERSCGNTLCDPDETPINCSEDCEPRTCGNNVCDLTEDLASCPEDCVDTRCGNGLCEKGENMHTCFDDCPWATCGNGVCEVGEESGGCAQDCFVPLCGNGICEYSETAQGCLADCPFAQQVDVLFIIDNSGSMAEEQALLKHAFAALYPTLRNPGTGALPDLHIGVATTDLGAGPFDIANCGADGGDKGNLHVPASADITGAANYMIDLAPDTGAGGCTITRDAQGNCVEHTCDLSHCPAGEEGLALEEDAESGCPRCRNFASTPNSTFSEIASVGTAGCGFEQPLEAMYKALDDNPTNVGFLRPDSLLAVVFVTDEDDCSASDPRLFDGTQSDLSSELGPLTSFRCFEFGVTCDTNNRTDLGSRHDCMGREDPDALLHPVSRYVNFLYGIKDPGEIVVASISGPIDWGQLGGEVTVAIDESSYPMLEPSCTVANGSAAPAVRLRTFAQYFASGSDIDHTYQSICESTFDPTLQFVGTRIREKLGY